MIKPLKVRILEELTRKPGQRTVDLTRTLGCELQEISFCLRNELSGHVQLDSGHCWTLTERASVSATEALAPRSEIARLCKYYLECISQDMDEGASVFAKGKNGILSYATLPSVPTKSDSDWWNAPGVGRLLGQTRAERGKLMLWLGYPVRLRQHQSSNWEGFFVEPVLMWPVDVPEASGSAPSIDERMPTINAKFLRSMSIGDGTQLPDEAALLSEQLGLDTPADELPDLDELIERLRSMRPDWDWQDSLNPSECSDAPPLANITKAGIYNRAVIIPAERSPYTQGLETELKLLSEVSKEAFASTALGHWLSNDASTSKPIPENNGPLIEVLPMNSEQRAAVQAALTDQHTVVTGPPGTGKSQVVTNMLVNAAWRGMKVLFASKNNKAVDVVEARVNSLGNRPALLRMGTKEYQAALSGHLTRLLAGNPGPEVKANYDESLQRYWSLAQRLKELDGIQQRTLDYRNAVDRLELEAEEARRIFGEDFAELTSAKLERLEADLYALNRAVEEVDRKKQSLLIRLLWSALRKSRFQHLAHAAKNALVSLQLLRLTWPEWHEGDDVSVLRALLVQMRAGVELVRKVVIYREELRTLQSLPTFEDVAYERAELTRNVSENSEHLWRDWLELAPIRLTPAQRVDVADYAAALQLITGPGSERVHPSAKKRAWNLQSKVTSLFSCWAVTSLSARGRVPMEPGFFDLVVIDEASQCDIASVLPLLYRAKRSVIIGDPMQLRHISSLTKQRDSELQHKHGLVETRLSWMYSVNSVFDVAASVVTPESIINLRDHHRSHADIIGFSNEAFYEGRLRVATRYPKLNRPDEKQPGVVWQDVKGRVVRPRSGGAQNAIEANAVADAVADLLVARGFTGTVGVVTPFRAQAQLIQEVLSSRPAIQRVSERVGLLVDTVHKFQGDECDVMFFSPVVSDGVTSGALGFLRSNGNLFNVAITRARGLLHVVGDREAASNCGVNYLEEFSTYVSKLDAGREPSDEPANGSISNEYPQVRHPERVSDWEKLLYRAMISAGLKPIPQFSVEQYDLDFALIDGQRRLAIEVDGDRYHRSWTGELCMRDQLRNQRLIELGWDVRRFWVYEIRDEIAGCVRIVSDWLASEPSR